MTMDDFFDSEVAEIERSTEEKLYERRMRKFVRKLYDLHYAATISEARFFAIMWGMTCG